MKQDNVKRRWNIKHLAIERIVELMANDNFHTDAQEAVKDILEQQQNIDSGTRKKWIH